MISDMAGAGEGADTGGEREAVNVSAAVALYLSSLATDARQETRGEVYRFTRWCGAERPIADLRGHDIALYGESLGAATPDARRRAEILRAFLSFVRKERLISVNLASHLRLRKSSTAGKQGRATTPAPSRLTAEGHASLAAEMEALKAQRPGIAKDLRLAMADKDFRENAPLDAARERQAHVETRIRELETLLRHAEVLGGEASPTAKAHLGSTLILRNLSSGAEVRYTLVSPSEVKPAEGKISIASPVGKALLERAPGDEVEVSAPAGVLRFRVEEILG